MLPVINPLVSIIIPVYNAEAYVSETIRSALDQTWVNKELIMVDDGSSDSSLLVIKGFEAENVKIFSQANAGASVARNRGLIEARGDYIQFLDADDLISADKITSQIEGLGGSQDHLAVCSTIYFTDGDNISKLPLPEPREWYHTGSNDPVDFLLKLYAGEEIMPGYGGMIQPNAWLTPRKLIEKAGPWNAFKCPDDDGEFFCRVILASKGIKFSSKGINYYRQYNNGKSLSAQKSEEALKNVVLSIDLKYSYLKQRTTDPILDKIFARYYYWTGVTVYPKFRQLSKTCIRKAGQLGYSGEKYVGGPAGHKLANYVGWKTARIIAHLGNELKKTNR